MNAQKHQTKCPQCETSFIVSSTQLKQAKGFVRCGSCLGVFNAQAQINKANAQALQKQQAAASTSPAHTQPNDTIPNSSTSAVPASRKPFDANPVSPPVSEQPRAPEIPNNTNTPKNRVKPEQKKETIESTVSHPSDARNISVAVSKENAWIGELIADLESDNSGLKTAVVLQKTATLATPEATPTMQTTDLEALEDLEDLLTTPTVDASIFHQESPHREKTNSSPMPIGKTHPKKIIIEDIVLENIPLDTVTTIPINDTAEEQELLFSTKKSTPKKPWLWSGLSLFALAVLASQYLFWFFPSAANNKTLRPVLNFSCQFLPCHVPDYVNLSAISVDNLIIRPLPHSQQLQVDAVFQNTATIEQPFPVLALTFADIHNKPTRTVHIEPKSYLTGDLKNRRYMPPKNDIHVQLHLPQQGDLINYHLSFLPPQSSPPPTH